jgi:hypothetical protein
METSIFVSRLGSTISPFRRRPLSPCWRPSPGGPSRQGGESASTHGCGHVIKAAAAKLVLEARPTHWLGRKMQPLSIDL